MHEVRVDCPHATVLGTATGEEEGSAGVARFHSIAYSHLPGSFERPEKAAPLKLVDAREPRPDQVALSITAPVGAKLAPVVVYIHGGRFEGGSHADPRTDGTDLTRGGIVTVAVGYRTGLSGFAKFSDDEYFHYRGIEDVQVALEWVQRNIESFGGDPTNVTLMGQSAGAAIAFWLARRDHFRGAFRRVIAASPAFPREGFEHRKATLRQALRLRLDRPTLAQASPAALARGYERFRKRYRLDMALGPWPFQPDQLAEVPVVVTTMREEFQDHPAAARADASFLRRACGWWLAPKFGMRREAYSTWADLSGAAGHPVGRLVGDATIRQWAQAAAQLSPGPTWMMEFIRASGPAVHAADLDFFFHAGGLAAAGKEDNSSEAHAGGLHAWLKHFAATGETGFEQYRPEHAVRVVNLDTGQAVTRHGTLDYVAQAFADEV